MEPSFVNSDLYRLNLNKAKLKAVTRTSTLFSGFAMVALVEMVIEINNDSKSDIPAYILHAFTIITCMLIGVHLIALMISTCLLPQIETLTQHYDSLFTSFIEHSSELKNDENNLTLNLENITNKAAVSMTDVVITIPDEMSSTKTSQMPAYDLNKQIDVNNVSNQLSITYENLFKRKIPFIKLQPYIELSWILSNGVGIFLFLIQVAFVCFIKFIPLTNAKSVYLSGWIIIALILIVFLLFSYRFYVLLVEHNVIINQNNLFNMNNDIKNLGNLSISNKNFQSLRNKLKKMTNSSNQVHDISIALNSNIYKKSISNKTSLLSGFKKSCSTLVHTADA